MILFYEMIHTWTHLFIPAIVFAFAALGFNAVAMAHHSASELPVILQVHPRLPRLVVFLVLAGLAFLVGRIAFYLWKPRLGFDD
jgi:hypothetical protein